MDLDELENIIIGKDLGDGMYRNVYDYIPDEKKVIKVANSIDGRKENIFEYKIYQDLECTKYSKYFAKCFDISKSGKYLIMEKIKFREIKHYPKKIPHFFTDIKIDNYGWTEKGKFVCSDYGMMILTDLITSKLRKANWN